MSISVLLLLVSMWSQSVGPQSHEITVPDLIKLSKFRDSSPGPEGSYRFEGLNFFYYPSKQPQPITLRISAVRVREGLQVHLVMKNSGKEPVRVVPPRPGSFEFEAKTPKETFDFLSPPGVITYRDGRVMDFDEMTLLPEGLALVVDCVIPIRKDFVGKQFDIRAVMVAFGEFKKGAEPTDFDLESNWSHVDRH